MAPGHGRDRECSVVIPVYNSQASLPALVERLAAVLPAVTDRFEVILVNDGSRDDSWDGIGQAARKHAWVRGINLMRNYGQHNALLAGIRAARFAVVVTMDDDLQHPPEEIPRLLEALGHGQDLVYGVPASAEHGSVPSPSSPSPPRICHPAATQPPNASTNVEEDRREASTWSATCVPAGTVTCVEVAEPRGRTSVTRAVASSSPGLARKTVPS